jgi:hypothetical protein
MFGRQSLVTLVKFDARLDHLLLTKLREFVGSQSVFIVLEEGVRAGELWNIGLELFYNGFVQFGFGLLWRY